MWLTRRNRSTFLAVFTASAGKKTIHARMIATAIINNSETILKENSWEESSVVSQNRMISMNARNGRLEAARRIFEEMPRRNITSWNCMISAYAKARKLNLAKRLFDNMPERNLISWNTIISGYVLNRRMEEARQLFDKMPERNIVSWTTMLAAYTKVGMLREARLLFDEMPERNVVSWTAMIDGYVKSGNIEDARQLFDEMPDRDVVAWTTMVAGYADAGRMDEAHLLFDRMPERNVVSWTAFVNGYAKKGMLDHARQLFDVMPVRNEVSLTAMITGYSQNGRINEAQKLFQGTQNRSIIVCNAMIAGYVQNGLLDKARKLFESLTHPNDISWTSVITGYAQSGKMDEALHLFSRMPEQCVEAWSTIIKGYVMHGFFMESLKFFLQMLRTGLTPNQFSLVNVLGACANLAALSLGQQLHVLNLKMGLERDVHLASALITMYAKSGSLVNAETVFRKATVRDTAIWNAMICGYAQHGHAHESLLLFEQLVDEGLIPDGITFLGVLSACTHNGSLDDGWLYFNMMKEQYHIAPTPEHCARMVGLLGRAGPVSKAENFINALPFKADAVIWGELLVTCKMHLDVDVAERAAAHLFELEPHNAGPYIALSQLYAAKGRSDDAARIMKIMNERGIKCPPHYLDLGN